MPEYRNNVIAALRSTVLAASTLTLRRAVSNILPSAIDPYYSGSGILGNGTYYAYENENYPEAYIRDSSDSDYGFVLSYKVTIPKLLELDKDDFEGDEQGELKLTNLEQQELNNIFGEDWFDPTAIGAIALDEGYDAVNWDWSEVLLLTKTQKLSLVGVDIHDMDKTRLEKIKQDLGIDQKISSASMKKTYTLKFPPNKFNELDKYYDSGKVIAALRKVIGNTQELIDTINEKWDYEFLMSEKADDLWEDEKIEFEENFETEAEEIQLLLELDYPPDTPREAWALKVERNKEDEGATGAYFDNPRVIPEGTWLIHFTNADPTNIAGNFKGNDIRYLGITKWAGGRGKYGFAFDALNIPKGNDSSGGRYGLGYGNNAIIFQADGVKAFHGLDGEDQVIFDIHTMQNVHSIYGDRDNLELIKDYDSFECERDSTCINKIIEHLEK